MKFTKTHLLLSSLMFAAAGAATAATINVPADQATIQAAVNAAAATGDTIIVAAGTYIGTIDINNKSLTLKGASPASRPVIVLNSQLTLGTTNGGVIIHGDGTTVTVQDLIFLPATTGLTGKAMVTNNNTAGATLTVNLTNLLFAPNNGSNVALITSPFDDSAIASGRWPGDVLYLINRNFVGLQNGVGIYNLQDVTVIGSGRDGIVCYPNGVGSSLTGGGIAVARAARNGIQWGDDNGQHADFTLTGTRARPSLLLRKNTETTAGSGVDTTGINASRNVIIDHMVSISHGATNNTVGFNVGVGTSTSVTITDSLFAGSATGLTLSVQTTPVASTVSVRNNTFFQNPTNISVTEPNGTYTIKDNVFAGAGTGVALTGVGTGVKTTLNNNAFVAAGANALTLATSGEAPAANTGVVTADPQYASTSLATLAGLATAFDVVNGAYFTASSTSGPLNGWGDGPASGPTAADHWTMYN
ncbi:hypothetical protein BH09SUM1_BH09SUM1_14560 [soil metagenome]